MAKGSVPELIEVAQLPVHHLAERVGRLARRAPFAEGLVRGADDGPS